MGLGLWGDGLVDGCLWVSEYVCIYVYIYIPSTILPNYVLPP